MQVYATVLLPCSWIIWTKRIICEESPQLIECLSFSDIISLHLKEKLDTHIITNLLSVLSACTLKIIIHNCKQDSNLCGETPLDFESIAADRLSSYGCEILYSLSFSNVITLHQKDFGDQ